ncbi:MAG: hypothetical protein ACK5PP_19760 [Acidimicrobiales bacterium]
MNRTRLAVRLLRHYRRETAVVVILAAVFIGTLSALEIARVGIDTANHQTLEARSSGRPEVGSLIDPAGAAELVAVEGAGIDPVWFESTVLERDRRGVEATVATAVSPGIEMGWYETGRPPADDGEVAVTEEVAAALDLEVGAELEVAGRARSVSGIYLFPSQPRAEELFLLAAPDERPSTTPDLYLIAAGAEPDYNLLRVIPVAIHQEHDVYARNGDRLRQIIAVTGPVLWLAFVLVTLGVLVRLGRARGPDLTGMVAGGMRRRRALGVFPRAGAIALAAGAGIGYLMAWLTLRVAPGLVAGPAGQEWTATPWGSPRLVVVVALFAVAMTMLGQSRIWIPMRNGPAKAAGGPGRLAVAVVELVAGIGLLVGAREPTSLLVPVMLMIGMLLIVDALPGLLGALRRRVYLGPVAKVLNRVDPLSYSPTRLAMTGLALIGLASIIVQVEALFAGMSLVPPNSLVVRDLDRADGEELLRVYGDEVGGAGTIMRTPDDTGDGMLRVIPGHNIDCFRTMSNMPDAFSTCVNELGEAPDVKLPAVDSSWTAGAGFDRADDVWYAADYLLGDGSSIGLVTIRSETNEILAVETVPAEPLELLDGGLLPAAVAPTDGSGVPADALRSPNGTWTLVLEDYTGLGPAERATMQYELTRRAGYGLADGDFGDEFGLETIGRVMWFVGLLAIIGSLVLWTVDVKATNREVAALTASEEVPRRRRVLAIAHVAVPVAVAGSIVTGLGLYVGSRVVRGPLYLIPLWPAIVAPIVIVVTIVICLRPRWRPATPGPRLAGRVGAVVAAVVAAALAVGCGAADTGDSEAAQFLDKARDDPGYLEGVADGYALTFQDGMAACMAADGFDYQPEPEEVAFAGTGDPAVDGLNVSTTYFNTAVLDGTVLGSDVGGVGAEPVASEADALEGGARTAYFDAFDDCEAEAHESALAAHPEVAYLFAFEQIDVRGPQQDLETAVLRCLDEHGYDAVSVAAIREELTVEVTAIGKEEMTETDTGPELSAAGIDRLTALQRDEQAVAVQLDACGWFAPTDDTEEYWDAIDQRIVEELSRLTAPS